VTAVDQSNGQQYNISYRVSAGAIVITARYPGETNVRRITTNGRDSCALTVTYTKIPGHDYFEAIRSSNREHMQMSDMHAEELSCSASTVQGPAW